MIHNTTKTILRTLALALTICATCRAWAAVKPLAVWNRDFTTRGNFVFTLNGNIENDDGTITIKTGSGEGAASGGLQFMRAEYVDTRTTPLVAIVGLSNVSMPTLNTTSYVLATSKVRYYKADNNQYDVDDRTGIQLYNKTGATNRFIGLWLSNGEYDWSATTSGRWSDASSITSGSHVFSYRYNKDRTCAYLDGNEIYNVDSLKSGDDKGVYGFSIGGLTAGSSRQLVGAEISSVVILQTADINEIRRWNFLKDLTDKKTTLNSATATSGVNLSNGETINSAITPAAVFVQSGSPTLTIQDGGSITIGGGTGMLYVADGASLNIDASAIPLSVSNPTYTILTGAIMGTVSVTDLPDAPEGYTVGTYVTDAYVAVALQKEVSITSPFDGTTLAAPTVATIRNSDAATVAFGNDRGYWQTVGGNDAIVAKVTGGAYSTAVSGFFSQTTALDTSRDVYMVLSGGSGRLVCGVQKCTWVGDSYDGSYETTGDAIVQIEDGTWQYVFGAGAEGAYSANAIGKVIGSTGVTLTGSGKVSGSVFGGWGSSHARNPTVTQNTSVRVENVQDVNTAEDLNYVKKGYIVGGSTYQASDANSCTTVSGNSSVIVDLDSEASGTFVKNIIGGSMLPDAVNYDQTGQIQAVAGNSSVSIVAPAAVTFSGNIIGGGYSGRGSNGGSSTVGGSASVTLTGGTYSGRIVAGGYAPNSGKSTVGTTATLTLNAGTVISSGAILDGGNATGLRTLAVADDFDFSNVTVQNFDVIQVAANKTLTLQACHEEDAAITLGAGAKLKIVVSSQDVYRYDGHLSYCTLTKGDGATLEYGFKNGSGEYVKIGEEDAINGVSLLPYFQTFKVSNGTAGGNINTASNWGGNAVPTGRNAAFYVNNADGITITIDADITFGDIQVLGSGVVTFTGTGGHKLSCANLDIDSGVTVKIGGTGDSEALNVSKGKISGDGSLEILSGAKMVLDGVTSANVIKLAGKLNTKGDTTLSGANIFNDNSVFTVESDRTELSADQEWVESDIYINSHATLAIGTSWFQGGPTANNYNLIYPYANLVLDVAGTLEMRDKRLTFGDGITIKLRDGASITGEGADGSYGNLAWKGNGKLEVYGDATIDATIRTCTNKSPSFDIDAGATLTICKPFIAQNKNSGTEEASDGSITKKGAGTLKLHNVAMTKPISGSEGTVELFSDSGDDKIHTATISFSGALKFVRNASSNGYHIIGDATNGNYGSDGNNLYLTGSASFETSGTAPYFILPAYMGGNYLAVANLTGSGTIEPVYGNAVKKTKTIRTKQTRETEFSGVMSGNTDGRNIGLVVYGDDSTVQPLKLTGVNTSYGPLTIDAYGKVIFSGSGSWLNGATTVKENGVIESQSNAEVAGAVTLESGATVSIVKVGGTLEPFTATRVDLPATGTVKVDLSAAGITSSSGATVIMACEVNDQTYLGNLSAVGYDGEGAFSYDDENNQIVYTPTAMEEWTYGSATWSSGNVTDSGSNTITYHDVISDVVFGAIASTPATITLDGKRTPASVTFNGGANTTYVIAEGSFEPVGTVTISSGTVKIDTDATLSAVTGSGTLEIGAGSTVTLTSNTALDGIASLTGTGTLILPEGATPSTSGLTALLSNANWRGTLVVSSITGNVERDFAAWGNSNSNIKMVGVEGKTKTSNVAAERTVAAGVVLDNGDGDFALKFTSILSGNQSTWTKISGSGTIVLEGNDQQVFEIRDSSGFTGSVSQQANAGRLSFVNNKGSGFKAGKGMITVYDDNNTEAYIGSGATWTAGNNGIQILGTLVIKGDARLDSISDSAKIIIVDNAKLQYDSLGTLTLGNAVQVVQSLDSNLNTSGIGTVKIAFGNDATLSDGAKLIDWSAASLAEPPDGTFVFDGATSAYKEDNGTYYVLTKDTTGLFVREAVAVAIKGGVTYHATVADAITAAGNDGTGSVIIMKSTTENIVYDKTKVTLSRLSTDITTGTIDPGPEYNAVPGTDLSVDSYPYTYTDKATTYYWTDAVDNDSAWSTVGNWAVGAADGPTATRAVTSIDSVVFNNDASVTRDSDLHIVNLTVNGEVAITATGRFELFFTGSVYGDGTLTLDNDCLKNFSGEAKTIPLSINFVNGARLAGPYAMTITGNVSVSDTFEVWGTTHIVQGNFTVANGSTIQTGSSINNGALTVTGTTTLNGSFTKTSQNTLTLGNVVVSASTTPTIESGTIAINGTVTVSDGAMFTIPPSGLTVGNSASFVLSGRSSVLVDNVSGASGKVSTSMTDGAKVISTTSAGVTTYRVVYGTIFSVY